MSNSSLKDNIYTYLNSQSAITALVDKIAWGQLPNAAIEDKRIIYTMIDDVRVYESYKRNQRWRFWICIPNDEATPKAKALTLSLKVLDALHDMRGSFGSTAIHYIYNVANQDPAYDEILNAYVVLQDYIISMKTLEA